MKSKLVKYPPPTLFPMVSVPSESLRYGTVIFSILPLEGFNLLNINDLENSPADVDGLSPMFCQIC